MLTNDHLALWDRENIFHPSTHRAQHARGETPSRIITDRGVIARATPQGDIIGFAPPLA